MRLFCKQTSNVAFLWLNTHSVWVSGWQRQKYSRFNLEYPVHVKIVGDGFAGDLESISKNLETSNARTWGYYTLGTGAAVDFSYLLYAGLVGYQFHIAVVDWVWGG